MPDHTALLADLAAWTEDTASFHGDRQLADRVLLACGWRCVPDPGHPAKVRWEFGTNPVYSAWEPMHPHPIQSLDAALGQVPYGWRVWSMQQPNRGGAWTVTAVRSGRGVEASHHDLRVAVCIVAVKAEAAGV